MSWKKALPIVPAAAVAGADMVNVAREAMLAVGCIQAQKCHTGMCPTGVATQNPWLERGLDPDNKAGRVAAYVRTLRRDLLKVSEAVGVLHPGLITTDDIELCDGNRSGTPLREMYGYEPHWGLPSADDRRAIEQLMAATAPQGSDEPV